MRQLPFDLTSKIEQSLQTIGNNADPKMEILVARAKSSVQDSSYFTVEKIKMKAGITKVTVAARRQTSFGPPDRIFNIHIDNGIVRTMSRIYPDTTKSGWHNEFDIGPGLDVSISFDGRWHNTRYKTWGKIDDELPWLFWVDSTNNLKARIWDIEPTIQLADNVIKIDSVRGWVPAQFGHTEDQGIIIAYIKNDGKAYYRNFSLQSGGLIVWEIEREIIELGTNCVDIRVFRTNDFRVGFIAEKSVGNTMVLTTRNWGGMSIEPIKYAGQLKCLLQLLPLEKKFVSIDDYYTGNLVYSFIHLWGSPVNAFTTAHNFEALILNEDTGVENMDWGYRIHFTTVHDLTVIHFTEFEILDSIGNQFMVTEALKISPKEFVLEVSNFNNAIGNLTITFTGSQSKGEADQEMSPFNIEFTPQNLVYVNIPIPEIEVIWNE